MPGLPPEAEERLIAAADLVGRTGAKHFEIGYLHDDVPAAEAAWFAHAQYRGGRIIAENHADPAEAAEALAKRLLTGARCACGKLVSLGDDGAFAFTKPVMTDGSEFTADQAAAAGLCRWRRDHARWISECGRGRAKPR
jgi:hypothetical protein